jgi:hypothetical protein
LGFGSCTLASGVFGESRFIATGIERAVEFHVHATFSQKVIICMIAAFLAAGLIEWGKIFVEGADDALNKGYKHRSVADGIVKP